jgi:light-regulated signal transduction histidine kinase (bacteriophytochrome)
MRSARHNDVANTSNLSAAVAGAFDEEQDGFYTDLADGLHAMAQPLTILRSAVAMLSLANEPGVPRHRCLDISARQIERVCDLFASLQDLVASRLEPASSAPMDLQALVTRMMEDRAAAFRERGIKIVAMRRDPLPLVLGDAQRAELAIAAVLEVALSASAQADEIEIQTRREGNFVELIVAHRQDRGRNLNAGELVNLSVAKANILSQQGKYLGSTEPFRVSLALPICESALQCERKPSAAYAN